MSLKASTTNGMPSKPGNRKSPEKALEGTRDFYEKRYETDWRRDLYRCDRFTKVWYRAALDYCVPQLKMPSSRVLEVGCGYGLFGGYLVELGAEFVGVDVALSAVSQFTRILQGKCHALVADGQALPFRDASYDLVCCMEVLEHAPDPEKLLDECFRVVYPGGHVIVSSPNYCNLHIVPKLLAELGVRFFRRYIGRQFIDRITSAFSLRQLLSRRGTIVFQRAVRLHPPLFEQLDYRFPSEHPLRRINDWIFSAERRWGESRPLNYLGLHTLFLVKADTRCVRKS
jgi:SAM-dependent methyltransferase